MLNEMMRMVEDGLTDMTKQLEKLLNEQAEDGTPPGMHELNALEHRVWFESMVANDPLWAVALPLVEGGMKELSRYEREVGLR